MRAVCEACDRVQPVDWKAGDLCVHCGQAVRRDVRCFWCAGWTPAARFCRTCGAETVDERQYGAARMLKDAGTDRFTVPKMLRELDPEQLDNFTRIYQRQAAIVARHVDDLRLCERHLHQRHWSSALEDELIPQLPWQPKAAAALTPPPLPVGDDAVVLQAIQAGSPFPATRTLAMLARLRRDDWSLAREAIAALGDADPGVRGEAALILAGWRAQTVLELYNLDRQLIEALRAVPLPGAAVRIAWLAGKPDQLPAGAADDQDPENAFIAALLLGERDRLRTALAGDGLQRIAAGRALIRLGEAAALAGVLAEGPEAVREPLISALASSKAPAPELEGVLIEVLRTSADRRLRERAARVLARSCRPGQAVRIAELAQDDRSVWQSLLQSPAVGPDDLHALGAFLVERGDFAASLFGMSDAAKPGRMPIGFVPAVFARADDERRIELCRFAEEQLGHRDDEALHRFLLHVMFGDHPGKLRAAAWWSLHRWYRRDDHRGEGPLRLEPAAIERFFGSVAAFVPRLTAVLADHDSLTEVGLYDRLAGLLGYSDDTIAGPLIACEAETQALVDQLLRVMGDARYHPFLRSGAAKALLYIAGHPRWSAQIRGEAERLITAGDGMYELPKLARAGLPAA